MDNLHQLAEYRSARAAISVVTVQNALAALGGEAHRDDIVNLVSGSAQPRIPRPVAVQEVDEILKGHSENARAAFRRVFGPKSHRWAFAEEKAHKEAIRRQTLAAS